MCVFLFFKQKTAYEMRISDWSSDVCSSDLEQADDAEAAGAEAGVVGQGVAQVADSEDDDRPVVGQADLPGDLVVQVGHVVTDPTRAVGAEVGQVLAELGAVPAGRCREFLARGGSGALLAESGRGAKIERKKGDAPLGMGGG